jgi:hypothetical protein
MLIFDFIFFRSCIKTSTVRENIVEYIFKNNFSMQKKSTSMHSLSTDMVSRIEYDEKEQECLAKEEQIQVNFSFY